MSHIGPESLAKLLDRHGRALELLARTRCSSPADVVQEAFVQLARQASVPPNVVAWLYRVVRNGAISAARAESRRRHHERAAALEAAGWFEPSPDSLVDPQAAADGLSQLPVEEREAIVLHVWCSLSFDEIAALCGTSSSTAHRRFHAGLELLRKQLDVPCRNTQKTRDR